MGHCGEFRTSRGIGIIGGGEAHKISCHVMLFNDWMRARLYVHVCSCMMSLKSNFHVEMYRNYAKARQEKATKYGLIYAILSSSIQSIAPYGPKESDDKVML